MTHSIGVGESATLTIGVVQHACGADREQNLARAVAGIEDAADRGAELVVLQELHNHAYFCHTEDPGRFDLAEPVPGPTTKALGDAARRAGACVVGSVFERRTAGIYHNTAVVLERDGALAGTYRKMHIPDDPGYQEKFYFTPGDQGFTPIDTSVGRLGVLVCWDQWYPEAARLMALAGAELLLFPSAIGWDPTEDIAERRRQLESWITIQRSHAIANGLPVVCCNRVGDEKISEGGSAIVFWGTSFVCGPQGEMLWQAETDRSAVGVVTIDRHRSEQVRRIWPFLRDRRIDSYGKIGRRFSD
jgi:N-carbamoylputrescine amidase